MKILITGAKGFLGSHLVDYLKEQGHHVIEVGSEYNLIWEADRVALKVDSDTTVIHCAADVGGIQYNLENAAEIYYRNMMMNTQLIDEMAVKRVCKLIYVSSVCAYPHNTPIPTSEGELFQGEIEKSNEAYGFSKLAALVQLRACKQQYGLNFSYPLLANLYGPSDRGFTDASKAHLVPNLIRQFCEHPHQIKMRGNGSLTRDLLYIEDAVKAIDKMIEVDYDEPVNISTNVEVSIKEIAGIIGDVIDYRGAVLWPSIPDKGEQRRRYDNYRAKAMLNWEPGTSIGEGLKRTIEWYKSL